MAAIFSSEGMGPRTLAFLPTTSAASLGPCSASLHAELGSCIACLCRPASAHFRMTAFCSAVRQALKAGTWGEPKKFRLIQALLERSDVKTLECVLHEATARKSLALGLKPVARALPDDATASDIGAMLHDTSDDVRRVAAIGLGRLGAAGAPYADRLARCVRDSSALVRLEAVEAIGMLGPTGAQHAEILSGAIRDSCPHVCARAMRVLGRMGGVAAAHSAKLLADDNQYVRTRAAATLGSLGASASMYVPTLAALLDDEHQDVRRTAHSALMNIVGPEKMLSIGGGGVSSPMIVGLKDCDTNGIATINCFGTLPHTGAPKLRGGHRDVTSRESRTRRWDRPSDATAPAADEKTVANFLSTRTSMMAGNPPRHSSHLLSLASPGSSCLSGGRSGIDVVVGSCSDCISTVARKEAFDGSIREVGLATAARMARRSDRVTHPSAETDRSLKFGNYHGSKRRLSECMAGNEVASKTKTVR